MKESTTAQLKRDNASLREQLIKALQRIRDLENEVKRLKTEKA